MTRPAVRRAAVTLTALLVLAGVAVVGPLVHDGPRLDRRDARTPTAWLDTDAVVAINAARTAPERPTLLGGGPSGWASVVVPGLVLLVVACAPEGDRAASRLRRWRARLLGAPPAVA